MAILAATVWVDFFVFLRADFLLFSLHSFLRSNARFSVFVSENQLAVKDVGKFSKLGGVFDRRRVYLNEFGIILELQKKKLQCTLSRLNGLGVSWSVQSWQMFSVRKIINECIQERISSHFSVINTEIESDIEIYHVFQSFIICRGKSW